MNVGETYVQINDGLVMKEKIKVTSTGIPAESKINTYLPASYSDCFGTKLPSDCRLEPQEIMLAFWTRSPRWIEYLFRLRNRLVGWVGIRSGSMGQMKENFRRMLCDDQPSDQMHVTYRNKEEIIICLDERHLKAYISVWKGTGENACLKISTVVHIKNRLGKVYFFLIRPFHKLLVGRMIRHILKFAQPTSC